MAVTLPCGLCWCASTWIQDCLTSSVELEESSHVSEQEIVQRSLPTGDSEQDCLPGAETACTELTSGGNGGAGAGEPDL